jgi:hypothetical protein
MFRHVEKYSLSTPNSGEQSLNMNEALLDNVCLAQGMTENAVSDDLSFRGAASNMRENERGSALVYILIAIALLAALTVSFMQPSGNQTSSQNVFKTVSELQSQIDFIRSAVHECFLSYPGGDITIDNTSSASHAMDVGADRRYPIDPSSDHFDGATIEEAANNSVKFIRCPGNPGDNINHAMIFGGGTGKFLPPPPSLFNEWRWYNGEDGIFFYISSKTSDAYIADAFDKLEENFSQCEADQIAGPSDLDGAGLTTCPTGSKCFRVWMVIDNVKGTDGPEKGLNDSATSYYPDKTACNTP